MQRKIGIQLRGSGRALKPRGPGVIRPKPQDRYGQPFKPKPIRPGKKDGGVIDKKKKKEQKETEKGTKPKDLIYKPNKMERLKQLREELGMKEGGRAKFPDLSGDGKVTKKDILMGRGVIKKKRSKKRSKLY
tara:strand:+ start:53 stop:448 length:396 start_codon:yes stop_codon:yes gene_type:complete